MREHCETGTGGLQSRPLQVGQTPWEEENDDALKSVYESNAPLILENHQESSVSSTYNLPLTTTSPQLMEHAERIYDRHSHAYMNQEFGLILRTRKQENTVISGSMLMHLFSKDPSTFQDAEI